MSNSTQNDEIEVDGETYTKWDTQNDEIKQMERAINEGFAESEKFLKGMRSPFDKSSTQNDHETHTACIERIKKEGASATCCHCNPHDGCTLGERVPEASKTIKKDWAIEYIKMRTTNTSTISQEVDYIDTLLADARREMIEGILVEMDRVGQGYASGDYVNGWSDCRTVVAERHRLLATLKEGGDEK